MAVTPGSRDKIEARKFYPYVWQGINRKWGRKSPARCRGKSQSGEGRTAKQGSRLARSTARVSHCFKYSGAIGPMDIAMISRQITTMLSAGVPLVQTLRLLASSHEKTSMRDLLAAICAEVESGIPLSQALKKYPASFR